MSTLQQFGTEHVFKGIGRSTSLVFEKGLGAHVWVAPQGSSLDQPAKPESLIKYLDLTCGIGVTNLGHCHPKITKAAQDQIAKLVHIQSNIAFNPRLLELVNALLPLMPHPSLDSFFFWNSGSEAVEASVKLARQATGRQNIIVMQGSYHGRTYGTMAMTKSKTVYSQGFGPFMSGVYVTPFPYWHQLGYARPEDAPDDQALAEYCLHQLELLLAQQTAPSDTAAIVLEPVLGEGGYVSAGKHFLEGLRKICDREGILLVIDEVQSGMGRCGTMFAIETIAPGLKPDVLVMAKGIANGFPLSAIVTRKELSDKQGVGSMGGTYGGNAVACAAGLAVVDAFKTEKVLDNANARSKEFFDALHKIKADPTSNGIIADVRGLGLMIGVEFNSPAHHGGAHLRSAAQGDKKQVDKVSARVQAKCYEKGMLVLTTSVYETLRLIPPLIISKEDTAEAIRIISESIYEVAKEG